MARIMKHIIFSLIFLALAASLNPTFGQTNHRKNKIERAKRKIERILTRFPELKTTTNTIVIKHDTVINFEIITEIDTVVIQEVDTILPLFNYNDDTTVFTAIMGLDTFQVNVITKELKVYQPSKTFYIRDTIRFSDTIINTVTVHKETTIVDKSKDFWFSVGKTLKGWIWWILIILGIVVILKLVLDKIKNKLL